MGGNSSLRDADSDAYTLLEIVKITNDNIKHVTNFILFNLFIISPY